MARYVVLLRGVNVGGKNKVPMSELTKSLEGHGFTDVRTYIQSGNVLLGSDLGAEKVSDTVEQILSKDFTLDSDVVRVLAFDHNAYKAVVAGAPEDFGQDPSTHRYDVIFLMGVSVGDAMKQIAVREGVDAAWPGDGVVYYRRPSLTNPAATRSYLGKVTQQPVYAALTIRNWKTTQTLLTLLEDR